MSGSFDMEIWLDEQLKDAASNGEIWAFIYFTGVVKKHGCQVIEWGIFQKTKNSTDGDRV